jgi:hypothetical protein
VRIGVYVYGIGKPLDLDALLSLRMVFLLLDAWDRNSKPATLVHRPLKSAQGDTRADGQRTPNRGPDETSHPICESICLVPIYTVASLPELRGTRAWIVVPRLSCESIESVPLSSFSRSSMLMRPSPRVSFIASLSKPAPESLTLR